MDYGTTCCKALIFKQMNSHLIDGIDNVPQHPHRLQYQQMPKEKC